MKNALIFLCLLITFDYYTYGEKSNTTKINSTIEYSKLNLENDSQLNEIEKSGKIDDTLSFVLSCGSGCALTYKLQDNHFLDEEKISATFSVTMWIDEKVSDEYLESYEIKFLEKHVQSIYSVGDKDYFMEEDSPALFKEVKKIGEILYERKFNSKGGKCYFHFLTL